MSASSCTVVHGIWGTVGIATLLLFSWFMLGRYVLRRRKTGHPEKWIDTPPGLLPPDAFSYLTRSIRYVVSASQCMPGQIWWRVLPEPYRSRVHDAHEVFTLALAFVALGIPAIAGYLLPYYALWLAEYVIVSAYYVVYISGLPPHLRRLVQLPIAYRMFFDEIVVYTTVAVFSAALYRSQAAFFGLPENAAPIRDSLYVSVVTMTTLGYGDHAPRECLRWITMAQVVAGIVVILVGFALAVARFAGYLQNGNGLERDE